MTAPPAQFDIYEVHTLHGHTVTPEEAAANAITIPDIEAHAVAIANAMFARAYGELSATEPEEVMTYLTARAFETKMCPFGDLTCGELIHMHQKQCHPLSEITSVTYNAPDTTVAFANITEGEQIDLFIPIASAPPLSDVQLGISHDPNFYKEKGNFIACDGSIYMQSPPGNDDLKNFITAIRSKGDGAVWDKTWLLDVIYLEPPQHDKFYEVRITEYGQTRPRQAMIRFEFMLP